MTEHSWEGLEVVETKSVGQVTETYDVGEATRTRQVPQATYVRAYLEGTDRQGIWMTTRDGETHQLVSPYDEDRSVLSTWGELTGPGAAPELGVQMLHGEASVAYDDPRLDEIENLLIEHPEQLDIALEDLESGLLDQDGYDQRVAELQTFKAKLEAERDQYLAPSPEEATLDQYTQELAEDGITGDPLAPYAQELAEEGISGDTLAANDWRNSPDFELAPPEPAAPEPPAPEPPSIDNDLDI
ncbi:hypothetical protein ACTVZO_42010 [Streptomyces sp. IBSNAI002]|uniref:hypothetical protein n=1 Tax=Streptomyces sp. IBSNAI002 TaxID=3457500 RepID=UPI003FCF53B2